MGRCFLVPGLRRDDVKEGVAAEQKPLREPAISTAR